MGAVLLALALVTTSCGRDPAGAPIPTPAPTSPTPTVSSSPAPSVPPTAPAETVAVKVFFMNAGRGDPCSEVFGVSRQVPAAAALRGALEALLAGPSPAERRAGYEGWFSAATADLLDGVRLDAGRAYVDFARELPEIIPNASSSCGSIGLLAQLDATTTQFPEVEEAWYALESDRASFYGWLQLAAPDDPAVPPTPPADDSPAPQPPDPQPTTPPPSGARVVPASLLATEWDSLPVTDRVVALTFDAGANGDGVEAILQALAAANVPATFFLTGRWVAAYPSYATAIGARYPVGNHSQTHPDLTTLDVTAVQAEIEGAHIAISDATGRDPRPWFRFPYGARDATRIELANSLGYGSVRWSVDTLGWKGTSAGMNAAAVTRRVLDDLHPGQIVLMHVGSHPTDRSTLDADALPTIIQAVRDAGYRFVDLDSMLP